MNSITNKTFDEERALYNLHNAEVENCTFAGPADGESALKESEDITVKNCRFSLRYPFWHTKRFNLSDSYLDGGVRAAMWYACDGSINNTKIEGVKFLRECKNIKMNKVTAESPEFGWRCTDLFIYDCDITSEYFLFESRNVEISNLRMKGKYSFQYVENMTLKDSYLDTKDAFWHTKNVTVKNSVVKGEYLAWYSDGLTLIDCKIIGTQPLCYCKNLTLINCTTEGCDLSFEYSDVHADISGNIVSVKNPKSGRICADSIGEIIHDHSVMKTDCEISVRK